ncbi:MAG: ribosomal large subunit pseudouridine synthase rRNA synthase [Candidatus Parcubacteria bacterium]|jgi:23S rRNA pseudouridine1911/1915/1917 synthase
MEMRTPEILLETEDFIAVNKPAGLITHSDGRTQEPSLAGWLASEIPTQRNIGVPWISPQGEVVDIAGLVHRLDRTTSGVLIAAKSNENFAFMRKQFSERKVRKLYRALVQGELSHRGVIAAEIVRSSEPPKRWYARPCDMSHPRAAVTEWNSLTVLQLEEGIISYLNVFPKTGRTHQIRVHLASVGHPIVGDERYGEERSERFGFSRPALHAFSIVFQDSSGKSYSVEAALPEDFKRISALPC